MKPPLLEVRELRKHYPVDRRGLWGEPENWLKAVDGVSFELERGHSLGLVGESGCGKSTLARTVIGLERATSGSVRLEGEELTGLSPRAWRPYRRRVQMIFQDPYASLDPRQTVGSILAEPLRIHRLARPRRRRLVTMALLEAVGLDPRHIRRYPHEFSGGQRQRIGIARALALEPDLILCDEAVSALDVSVQAQIVQLLRELQERFGLAYLFIAHDLAVVRHLCPEIAVMYLGRVVEQGTRQQIFESPRHPYTQALLSAVPDVERESAPDRIVMPGEVPSPIDPPSGCSFHPRCFAALSVASGRCEKVRPELETVGEELEHRSACHLRA